MIGGLQSGGMVDEAILMFKGMLACYLSPSELTFVSLVSSCSGNTVGGQVHSQVVKRGFEAYTVVSNSMITMYANFEDMVSAYVIFESQREKDDVSWNAIISGYSQWNCCRSAISSYIEMQKAELRPDEFTFGSLLASSDSLTTLEMIHSHVLKTGLISSIQGLQHFSQLLTSGFHPNEHTLTIALSICASISAAEQAKQIHAYILRSISCPRASLGNALITTYSKCGLLDSSSKVFSTMSDKDAVSWNSLISAYAQHGEANAALQCLNAMSEVSPDQATFSAVLSACSHAGLVDEGVRVFNSMVDRYGIKPGVDHFSCIIDLLGRAGYFTQVEKIIESEHFEAHPNIWWTLISACATHGNLELGRRVAGYLLETERHNSSAYVLLSNIYAAAGQWEEAANVRQQMDAFGTMKQPGHSYVI
ncbi:Pentatricopeptide repeat-containing protein At3g49740 [Linum grandiflorum]